MTRVICTLISALCVFLVMGPPAFAQRGSSTVAPEALQSPLIASDMTPEQYPFADSPLEHAIAARWPQSRLQTLRTGGMPEILVKDSNPINADIASTRDDEQLYIVLSSETIQWSGISIIEHLLPNKLSANYIGTWDSPLKVAGGVARVNKVAHPGVHPAQPAIPMGGRGIRPAPISDSQSATTGLGLGETMIPMGGWRIGANPILDKRTPPDISEIRPPAVRRVEVVAATATGIYRGRATTYVVKVVVNRDYSGVGRQSA